MHARPAGRGEDLLHTDDDGGNDMSVATVAAPPVGTGPAADKEMLISGCAAIAQALRLASIDVVTA